MATLKNVFTDLYTRRGFGGLESVSGTGSDEDQTRHLRRELPLLLDELDVRTLCDVPCGDFNWLKHTDLSRLSYIGGDIVEELVENNHRLYGDAHRRFEYIDIVETPLPRSDAILCRDCLVHLPLPMIFLALQNVCHSGSTYLITTTFSYRAMPANGDCQAGDWRRLNFELTPFNWPPPQRLLIEGTTETGGAFADKSLGVWPISQIRGRLLDP